MDEIWSMGKRSQWIWCGVPSLQAATWSYPFEMAVEITRVVISDVVTPADVMTLQSGSPREARQVRNKIAMVQRLLKTGGVPAVFGAATPPR